MVAIQLRGTVQRDGTVVLKLPAEVNPGEHEMVLVLPQDAQQETDARVKVVRERNPLQFRAYPVGLQDDAFTFRREDIYGGQP